MHAVAIWDFQSPQDYTDTLNAMRAHISARTKDTSIASPHQIWLLEHPSVFTQGQAGRAEHLLEAHGIPVVPSDRGGQITYHGPGQLIAYCLFHLAPLGLDAHTLVHGLEQATISYLASLNIKTHTKEGAPGVYTEEKAKICSVGLRIRQGISYHGLSLNVAMDLSPFTYINPCGYPNLKMSEIRQFSPHIQMKEAKAGITTFLCRQFNLSVETIHTV